MKTVCAHSWLTAAAACALLGASAWGASAVEPKASEQLKKMSDFLGSKPAFTVRVDGSLEVVTDKSERLQFLYQSDIKLKRPNKLRSDRIGEKTSLEFYYDGSAFSILGRKNMYYATAPAPGTIDEAIDVMREKLAVEAPAADLLYKNSYQALMEDVVSGRYINASEIDGVLCHHLAFRGNETDWQIWIEDGVRPVPHRFVITSKKVTGSPQFEAAFSQWNLSPKLDESVFAFKPPANAKRIEFLPATSVRSEKGNTP